MNTLKHPPYTPSKLIEYEKYLQCEERSQNTIEKYIRDIGFLFHYLKGEEPNKELLLSYKEHLCKSYMPSSVNSMLAAINGYFQWIGQSDLKVKSLKIQRSVYANEEKEITKEEYLRLVASAKQNKKLRLSLILQTICATGIRISELSFITVESIQKGRTNVYCKGKNRIIFIPRSLCLMLKDYCKQKHIKSGIIFCSKNGVPLDRSNIWKEMKALCASARVSSGKVFPHNLRHLFARTYYQLEKDLSRLSDLLGHSSINTTRIYTMESGVKHAAQLEELGLISPNAYSSCA